MLGDDFSLGLEVQNDASTQEQVRVLGIDPSSTICGIALLDTPASVICVDHWERNKRRSHPEGFADYYEWLSGQIRQWQPQMAVVEMLSVERNAKTTRAVSWYQAISGLCCKRLGLMVVEARVSTARSIVLHNGGMSKDEAWEKMRERYPVLFSRKDQGGLDEMDSLVLALAGVSAAERP